MYYWLIPLITVGSLLLISIAICLICFFKIYYSARKEPKEEYPIPPGQEYEKHRERMIEWVKMTRALGGTEHSIVSHDGLRLYARYYEYGKGAPIEILFHGYRGSAERDLSGGVDRCFRLGHSALIVDHRAAGRSQGHIITFGAKESRDCLDWVDHVIANIDPEAPIILTGISMGAATVLIAAGEQLPKNVVGVLADCGYTSTEAIIKKVIRDMHLPAGLLYPFARLAARLLGGFDPNAKSPVKAMESCSVPVIFFHGDSDGFVPADMSRENFAACKSERKRLVITPGADHGLCFPTDEEGYLEQLRLFYPDYCTAESKR